MNKQYPTLFSRDSTGNIREWRMEQEDNKYRTVSNVQNGAAVTSEWTVCEGKNLGKTNATTGITQATSDIENQYKKKQKHGYHLSVNDIDTFQYIEPILAYEYEKYEKSVSFTSKQWGWQTKFNGMAVITSKPGCFSRTGEKLMTMGHVEASLKPYFDKYPNMVLHGEGFNDDLRRKLNEILRLCRKTKNVTEEDLRKSEQMISYYIYDGYNPDVGLDESAPYYKRKEWIDNNIVRQCKYCVEVPTHIISDKSEVDVAFDNAIHRGDEGLIFRKMDMPYKHGRSKDLLKYKPERDSEAVILDLMEGVGNWSGAATTVTLLWQNKMKFDATFKGKYEVREEILKNKDQWIGKEVKFLYVDLTGLGVPASARIDPDNCDPRK